MLYSFLGLLPVSESLAIKGVRLQDTPQHRQNKVYGPDSFLNVQVINDEWRLNAAFTTSSNPIIYQGEENMLNLKITNMGTKSVQNLWIVFDREDLLWLAPRGLDGSLNYYFHFLPANPDTHFRNSL